MVIAGRRGLLWTIAPMALTSCAINQLRVESAKGVAAAAKTAAAATRAYLDTVDRAQLDISMDIVALDANCTTAAYMLSRPRLDLVRDPRNPPRGWLCQSKDRPGTTFPAPLVIGPIGQELEPTIALVDALGAYMAAITDITDAEASDPAKDLADAFVLARSAEALLRSGLGGTAVVPAADDKRLTAVTGFITLIAQLDREQDQVAKLRILAAETASNRLIEALRDHLADWELSRKTNAQFSYVIAGVLYGQSARIDPPLPATLRRDYASAYYRTKAPLIAGAKFAPALDRSLGELADADGSFRTALMDHPPLTRAQKRRLAVLTRTRLVAVFDTLSALLMAARGI